MGGRTFRIRGVPHEWDRVRLQSFLAEQDASAGPTVKSLAKEFDGRSQTATVLFRNAPPARRTLDIPPPVPSDQFSESPRLTFDDGFLGITTLCVPPPQDHKVE